MADEISALLTINDQQRQQTAALTKEVKGMSAYKEMVKMEIAELFAEQQMRISEWVIHTSDVPYQHRLANDHELRMEAEKRIQGVETTGFWNGNVARPDHPWHPWMY